MAFSIKWYKSKWDLLIARFPIVLADSLQKGLGKALLEFREIHREARMRGRPGVNRRTGDLIRSFLIGGTDPGTKLAQMRAWLASRSEYAGIQEFGGTIFPTKGQYLAVPLPAALTPAGVLKGKFIAPGGLRNVPGLILIRKGQSGRHGQAVLGMRIGKSQFFQSLFVLKRSVTIPPRLGFYDAFRSWIGGGGIRPFVMGAIRTAWNKAKGK